MDEQARKSPADTTNIDEAQGSDLQGDNNTTSLAPDLDQARQFLTALDPTTDVFTFQTFDDNKSRGDKRLAQIRHGTLAYHQSFLARSQQAGCGVFVTVQETDGKGRKNANIVRIRALFQEDDGDGKPLPLEPHIVVESSPGKFHRYWKVDGLSIEEFRGLQQGIINHYGSDPNVKDQARVMRLPGFLHQKREPVPVRLVVVNEFPPYSRDAVLSALPLVMHTHVDPPKSTATPFIFEGNAMARAREIVCQEATRTHENPKLGRHYTIYKMGCYFRRDGLRLKPDELESLLQLFADNMRPTDTSGRVVNMNFEAEAKALYAGYFSPSEPDWATVDASAMLAGAAGEGEPAPAPPPIAYPDPFPGFMADVCRNVLDTAMAPQPHLTTLAVLIGMAGSIGGRYHLPSGGRLNLYGIGIADSGTGKDHPQGVARQIAGEAEAKILGKPASGQALEDELDDYAAIFLCIDEIAHLFESINGKNKAPHLIELASMLLRLFSDSKRTYYTRSRAKAKGVTPGRPIPHPCLSVLGFATPQKLGESVTIGNVEDGLLGRMLFAPGLKDVDTRRIFTPFDLGDRAKECKALFNRPPPHLAETTGNIPRLDEEIHRVRYAPEADAALDQLITEINEAKKATEEAFDRALMARTFEKAERVAGVLAVWDKPEHPVMTAEHVAWAASLVRASNATARGFVRDHVHEGDVLKYAERVKDTMLKIMDGKITPMRSSWARLKRAHNVAAKSWVLKASKLGKPEFDKGVDHLIDEEILKKGGGREQAGCGKEPEWLCLVNPS